MNIKKTMITFLSLILIIGYSACTKTEYYPEENPNRTVYVDILSANWVPNATNTVWAASADISEIDALIMDAGTVLVDISFDNGKTFSSLSHVYNRDGYRFEYGQGYILVDVQATDGDFILERPAPVILKIILVDSNLID